MTQKRLAGMLIAIALAVSAVSVGAVASASRDHHHDDGHQHSTQDKQKDKARNNSNVASARAGDIAGASVGELAFGTLERPRDIAITMSDDLRFDPGTIVVAQGETIRFLLENPTAAPHDFTIGDLATQLQHAEEMAAGEGHHHGTHAEEGSLPGPVALDPGESAEVIATFDDSGELIVGCHVPGHWEAGMRAEIDVVDLSEFTAGTEAAPREVPVVMTDDLRFDPELIVVTAGETVRFALDNPTAAPHDFTIGDAAAQAHHAEEMVEGMGHHHGAETGPIPDAVALAPGETAEVLATFQTPGEHEHLIGCHVPGHWEAGMRGRIVVLPAPA